MGGAATGITTFSMFRVAMSSPPFFGFAGGKEKRARGKALSSRMAMAASGGDRDRAAGQRMKLTKNRCSSWAAGCLEGP